MAIVAVIPGSPYFPQWKCRKSRVYRCIGLGKLGQLLAPFLLSVGKRLRSVGLFAWYFFACWKRLAACRELRLQSISRWFDDGGPSQLRYVSFGSYFVPFSMAVRFND